MAQKHSALKKLCEGQLAGFVHTLEVVLPTLAQSYHADSSRLVEIFMQRFHAWQAERGEVAVFPGFANLWHTSSLCMDFIYKRLQQCKNLHSWKMMVIKKTCARIFSVRSQFCVCSQSRVLILEFFVIHGADSWPAIHCSGCQPWIEGCVIYSTIAKRLGDAHCCWQVTRMPGSGCSGSLHSWSWMCRH